MIWYEAKKFIWWCWARDVWYQSHSLLNIDILKPLKHKEVISFRTQYVLTDSLFDVLTYLFMIIFFYSNYLNSYFFISSMSWQWMNWEMHTRNSKIIFRYLRLPCVKHQLAAALRKILGLLCFPTPWTKWTGWSCPWSEISELPCLRKNSKSDIADLISMYGRG